jgi:hypothetical protein
VTLAAKRMCLACRFFVREGRPPYCDDCFEAHQTEGVPMQLDFGEALHALKRGKRVAREGWNGKRMWLTLVQGHDYRLLDAEPVLLGLKQLPWIGMRTAQWEFVPWLASQTDMLATDWVVVPDEEPIDDDA